MDAVGYRGWQRGGAAMVVVALVVCAGCQVLSTHTLPLESNEVAVGPPGDKLGPHGPEAAFQPPTELNPVSHPTYRVEPPDVLLIDVIRMAPKPPYFIQTLDLLQIVVLGTLPDQPIAGTFQVEPDGTVNLGPSYGSVKLAGMSITEASDAIHRHLQRLLTTPEVSVSLLQQAGQQQIAGEHLVGPDGTVNLGIYGSVYVSGMTLEEARAAIEKHLSQFLEAPQVSLDVFAYNSKVFYIVTEGAGFGDNVVRLPVTGKETVLDAIAQIGGLQRISSKKIWIARPGPSGAGCDQILVVNWSDITKGGATGTNYQLLPGDRVFIAEDHLIAMDSLVAKATAPFERIFGFLLLSNQTIQTIQRYPGGLQNF